MIETKNKRTILCSEGISINLSEIDSNGDIQLLFAGKNYSKKYGEMTLTERDFDEMILNFNEKVREIEIQINYDHMMYSGEASGWIKKIYKKVVDGVVQLWAAVKWTDEAIQKIRDEKYKYISSEWEPEYTHNKTAKKYKNVFVGAALTNLPLMKGMQQVSADESNDVYFEQLTKNKEDKIMTKTEMIAKLSEDHGVNVMELQESAKKVKAIEEEKTALSVQLSESKRNLAAKETEVTTLSDQLKAQEKVLFDAKYKEAITKAMSEGKITKAEADGTFRELAEKDFTLAEKLLNERVATVNTNTKGHDSSNPLEGSTTAREKLDKLADIELAENKDVKDYSQAWELAKTKNPDLTEQLKNEPKE